MEKSGSSVRILIWLLRCLHNLPSRVSLKCTGVDHHPTAWTMNYLINRAQCVRTMSLQHGVPTYTAMVESQVLFFWTKLTGLEWNTHTSQDMEGTASLVTGCRAIAGPSSPPLSYTAPRRLTLTISFSTKLNSAIAYYAVYSLIIYDTATSAAK